MEILLNIIGAVVGGAIYIATIVVLHKRNSRKLLAAEEQAKAEKIRSERDLRSKLAAAEASAKAAEHEANTLRENHRAAKQNAFDRVYSSAQAKIADPLKKTMGSTTGRLSTATPRKDSYASHPSNGVHYRDEGAFVNGLFLGAVLSDTVEDAFETNSAVQQDVIHHEPAPAQEAPSYTTPVYDNSPSYSSPSYDSGSSSSYDSGSSFSSGDSGSF